MKPKILIINDGGGFSFQTKCLTSGYEKDFEIFYLVPQDKEMDLTVNTKNSFPISKVTAIYNTNKIHKVIAFIKCFFQTIKILRQNDYSNIIAIGTSTAVPVFMAAKLFKVRTVFIDSITRVNDLSQTAKILLKLKLPTKTLTQWESLSNPSDNVFFEGNIL